jgi:sugar phosphate isomerase/epimerase
MTRVPRLWIAALCAGAMVAIAASSTSQTRVQVGYCTSLKNLAAARSAGFDYVELATTELAALSDADFERTVLDIQSVGLPTPVANLFLPATLKVTGPAIDPQQQATYVATAFERLSRVGVSLVVFGSGGARRVPDGFGKEEAYRQLVEFGRRIAPLAAARGITVAIEPLRRAETNIINTAAEGLGLVEAVDHPAFQLMIDFYHLASEREDPGIIMRARTHLRHLHVANPNGRVFPREAVEFEYESFFAALRSIGYAGRISVEAATANLQADAPSAIAMLRRFF